MLLLLAAGALAANAQDILLPTEDERHADGGGIVLIPQCVTNDFTQTVSFADALATPHYSLITLEAAKFQGRWLIGQPRDPGEYFVGNAVAFTAGDCTVKLWYDFSADLYGSLHMIPMLPNVPARVTYDPVSGLVTLIQVQ